MILFWAFVALAAAEELSQQGARAMREGRFADAERIYRQMLKASPDDPRLRMNLGLALHSGHKFKQAIPELERYLKASPKPGPVHLMLGVAHLKLGRPCDAIEALEKARQWQSGVPVLVELGDAQYGCKRFLDAARTYRSAAELQPDDPRFARAGARAFWQAREYPDARRLYAAMAHRHGTDPEFLYEYGDTLARLEGPEAGLASLQRAVEAAPGLVAARGALGRVLMDLHRAAESVPHLEAGAAADPTLLLPLSRAYKATGRAEDAARAEAQYRQALGRPR
ncbi:MAG: tetratricopeptide repeat protein [Bryobacteraceae bacterium]